MSSLRLSVFLAVVVIALTLPGEAVVIRNSSPVTLPFARRLNFTGAANLVKHDQARAKALKTRATTSPGTFPKAPIVNDPVTNGVVDYVANVGVGDPPTTYSLLIDTGSSNTWVGAGQPYVRTTTSVDTGDLVEVVYGSGFVIGQQFLDQVTLAPGLVIQNQSIGAALEDAGFDGVDGIVGIGPVDLTCGTLFPDETECIPTVTDNAFAQGLIDAHEIGISFEPTDGIDVTNGELTFGGVDESKFTGPLTFVPITTTAPASEFVGIDQTVTYGAADTPILPLSAGITDTGTTLLLLATDAFNTYQNITGAVFDNDTGLLRLTPDQFANLKSLFFHIGDTTFEFTPNAQIFPRALNTAIGGSPDFVYLITNDLGSNSGEGFDFVDGMVFLERFYYVFDIANSQVGFATTPFTNSTVN
ncbi:acid protease [Lentinus tigrinus ALCF2SS1-7]|uniref:Acid protease n=1 Tax=Lentinus tigrinus ALCF2SS1-6 TaxID=1328759 RepID=A0A5C2SBD3_9APHY|nr:acid protease [Lentinus tigrinus ALCF2SS1-6]RPD75829.1 acid protease [Lentinus tigrinus ALCF2SS1-7]